jgi:hypothetical protein
LHFRAGDQAQRIELNILIKSFPGYHQVVPLNSPVQGSLTRLSNVHLPKHILSHIPRKDTTAGEAAEVAGVSDPGCNVVENIPWVVAATVG